MAKIIITIPMEEEDKKIIADITSLSPNDISYLKVENLNQEILENCEIILGNIPPKFLQKIKNLKWIHLNSAGVNSYIDILSKDIILTNSTGAYDLALAEHALALIFALNKKIPNYLLITRNHFHHLLKIYLIIVFDISFQKYHLKVLK